MCFGAKGRRAWTNGRGGAAHEREIYLRATNQGGAHQNLSTRCESAGEKKNWRPRVLATNSMRCVLGGKERGEGGVRVSLAG